MQLKMGGVLRQRANEVQSRLSHPVGRSALEVQRHQFTFYCWASFGRGCPASQEYFNVKEADVERQREAGAGGLV